ncbi:TetR/AcrR family transcriptional regulator [Xinfangfangia sp. CPCC 101601]|uniref:TetR/AcrR family transcriptional regulator n=1 Tax=Pseudogemmobacter lacusdianii TaxID=3069608 RepID=A0ABU0W0K2_9RHOB|nr:TetR/AcrR family transcriptional regulator [Xinfangfangia sp. CPCC 101601]MDQ2067539.1 TetR/AcrR family transcriptional regulator [Xinfangfangia sp. CPCC 101601]
MKTSHLRAGNIKVTREDWLWLARDLLIDQGVEAVRILSLGQTLGVSRSSFYWYFKSRQDLLDQLLESWRAHNTRHLVTHAERAVPTIAAAVLAVWECWMDPRLFDPKLDFAIRAWARRVPEIRQIVEETDAVRLSALVAMYRRHGYAEPEATVRARVLYLTQIAYFSLEISETIEARFQQAQAYILTFTGQEASAEELAAFGRFIETLPRQDAAA